ncbi:MAG: neutral/alkaline non-lysosomal ceramidase N-terminal domain-containing protein [Pirellulaceae bacterium]
MMSNPLERFQRREFLARSLQAGAAIGTGLALPCRSFGGTDGTRLKAGEAIVDSTPPLGIELAGFHRSPGKERRIKGIRQPAAVRALVLQHGETQVAILSADICGFGEDVARRIQQRVASQVGIPAEHVRVCATHTHSMPALFALRQWGGTPREYMATVEQKAVQAVERAQADLAPAAFHVGKSRCNGANFNRTTKDFRTDAFFSKDSTESERWLDTMCHVLYFERTGPKRDLLWYHFSAHPVCYTDELAGPDWPGLVDQRMRENQRQPVAFLQGHAGDVNPGPGDPRLGEPEKVADAVYAAIQTAVNGMAPVEVDAIKPQTETFDLPLDMDLFKSWLKQYRENPSECSRGPWVDAGFAKDWFEGNADRDPQQTQLPISLSGIRIGRVGLVFHPAELYSYYGLAIRRDSPLPDTIVVGYADGIIGYLADPRAYEAGEYAAIVVPKILDFPPFTRGAAQEMAQEIVKLLGRTAG